MGAQPALTSTDAELVQRCVEGDQLAWAEIVRLYSRRIYNLAYRFTSSHSAAEDLTQEVFIRVYRSLNQYDPGLGDLSNWLMRLARNLVIDDYRKRQRTPTDSGDDLAAHEYRCRGQATVRSERWNARNGGYKCWRRSTSSHPICENASYSVTLRS